MEKKIDTRSDFRKEPDWKRGEEIVIARFQTDAWESEWVFNVASLSELKERMEAVAKEHDRSHILDDDGNPGYFRWGFVYIPYRFL